MAPLRESRGDTLGKWGHLTFVLRGTGVPLGPGTHCWDSHGGGMGCQKLASMVTRHPPPPLWRVSDILHFSSL